MRKILVDCTLKISPNCLRVIERTNRCKRAVCYQCNKFRHNEWLKKNKEKIKLQKKRKYLVKKIEKIDSLLKI